MKKILAIIDSYEWSYHNILKGILNYGQRHLTNAGAELAIASFKTERSKIENEWSTFETIFPVGWQLITQTKRRFGIGPSYYSRVFRRIPDEAVKVGIHSHRAWDRDRTLPTSLVSPPKHLVRHLSRFRSVNAVSRRLYRLFSEQGLRNLVLTEPGVDHELFRPRLELGRDKNRPLRVGFSGNSLSTRQDQLKGYSEFFVKLKGLDWIELKSAVRTREHYVPFSEMPAFYNEIDVYLCTSNSEGFSQSVLEAASTGRPVISTPVGGCEDLITEGVTGFLVERSLPKIVEKLKQLHDDRGRLEAMGQAMRSTITEKFSWEKRAGDWVEFLVGAGA